MIRSALLLSLATLVAACSDEKSTVVVAVYAGSAPIARVAQLRVRATNGQMSEYSQELFYPEKPRAEDALLELNSVTPVTFSMSFRTMFKGTVTFEVDALDPNKAVLGSGESSPEQLNEGQVTYSTVRVSLPCNPLQPTATCGAQQNCAYVCDSQNQAKTVCLASGLKGPGEVCSDLSDCAPGSECFGFNCLGTSIKTCRKFCATDADCGTGATCVVGITACSTTPIDTRVCSQPCNPTGAAIDVCQPGMNCFIFAGEVTDCACRAPTRIAGIGQACTNDDDCIPGLTCVDRSGQKTCRPLCALAAPACPTGTTCTPLNSPVYKVYGACL